MKKSQSLESFAGNQKIHISNEKWLERSSVKAFNAKSKETKRNYIIKNLNQNPKSFIELKDVYKGEIPDNEFNNKNSEDNFDFKKILNKHNNSLLPVKRSITRNSSASISNPIEKNHKEETKQPQLHFFKTGLNLTDKIIFNQAKYHKRTKSTRSIMNNLFRNGIKSEILEKMIPKQEKFSYPMFKRKIEITPEYNTHYFKKKNQTQTQEIIQPNKIFCLVIFINKTLFGKFYRKLVTQ